MKIRKLDYIIVFLLVIVIVGIQLMAPITVYNIVGLFIFSLIISAIVGTLTNIIRIVIKILLF